MAQALKNAGDPLHLQARYEELKRILEDRRDVLNTELSGRLRGVRAEIGSRPIDGQDFGEIADTDMQDDIQFALLEMKAETLNKVHEALTRLEYGRYGQCRECGGEIAEARLRALPFALRCRGCEAARETTDQQMRAQARRAPLFEVGA
ncbi:MAG: TraR/DksA family transcriptional regulator [Vicinamibacterales bacterium]